MPERGVSSPPKTLLGRLARWPALILAALGLSWFASIVIEWIGMTFFWSAEGSARSARTLQQDLAWLRSHRTAPLFGTAAWPAHADLVDRMAGGMYYWAVQWTGIEAAIEWLLRRSFPGSGPGEYLRGALNATRIFCVRLAITVTAIPLFALAAYWGAVEGSVRRDLRRFGGDIEHGIVYHWAKHLAGAVICFPAILYLAWPGSVNPAIVFVPFALFLGINVLIVVSNFTKYV